MQRLVLEYGSRVIYFSLLRELKNFAKTIYRRAVGANQSQIEE